jgi:hypothetical protein
VSGGDHRWFKRSTRDKRPLSGNITTTATTTTTTIIIIIIIMETTNPQTVS